MLPTDQADYPSRPVLSPARLHGRREGVFLFLTATCMVCAAALPLLAGRRIDVAAALGGVDLPVPMSLPVGVLALPLALVAVNLACELFGARRGDAIAVMALVVNLLAVGLIFATDALPGTSAGGELWRDGLPLAAASAGTLCIDVLVFCRLRSTMADGSLAVRHWLAALFGQLGWGVFALVSFATAAAHEAGSSTLADDLGMPVLTASVAFTVLGSLAGILLLAPAAPLLRVYVRVLRPAAEAAEARAAAADPAWAAPPPLPEPSPEPLLVPAAQPSPEPPRKPEPRPEPRGARASEPPSPPPAGDPPAHSETQEVSLSDAVELDAEPPDEAPGDVSSSAPLSARPPTAAPQAARPSAAAPQAPVLPALPRPLGKSVGAAAQPAPARPAVKRPTFEPDPDSPEREFSHAEIAFFTEGDRAAEEETRDAELADQPPEKAARP